MDKVAEQAVGRVIAAMHENLGEQLTLDDMARTAMFSKYHFSRLFQRITGLSPGRYLSAVRIERAKQLLLSTSLSVTHISHDVGYASVGTFSATFRSSVGVSPTTYRVLSGRGNHLPSAGFRNRAGASVLRGNVWPARPDDSGAVFVGLFPERIPQGAPTRCAVLLDPGPYSMHDVPAGTWHLLGYSRPPDHRDGEPPLVAAAGPLTVRDGRTEGPTDLRLRPMSSFDPPMLLALPDPESLLAAEGVSGRC